MYLRYGITQLMEKTLKYNVPFTIISGGIGNFAEIALKSLEGVKHYQLKSNYFTFDEKNRRLNGCTQPIINSYIKSYAISQVKVNPYVILLGDSVSVRSS